MIKAGFAFSTRLKRLEELVLELDNKKSGRRRLAPKSAGRLDDKGGLCLFSKTEATRGAGAWS